MTIQTSKAFLFFQLLKLLKESLKFFFGFLLVRALTAHIHIMQQFTSILSFFYQVLNPDLPAHMLPPQMLHPSFRRPIGDDHIHTIVLENALDFQQHPGRIHIGMFGAEEGIDGGLIQNHVISFAGVVHLSHIHHMILHFVVPFLLLHFLHLGDHGRRDVVVDDVLVPVLVQFLLDASIPTPQVQNLPVFIIVQFLVDQIMQGTVVLQPVETLSFIFLVTLLPVLTLTIFVYQLYLLF